MSLYIPLHAHNAYGSINDSLLKIEDYVDRGIEYGLPALAMTDHGSISSMYTFNHLCREKGVKPIFGCEVYEVKDHLLMSDEDNPRRHLIVLAKTNEGVSNLLKIANDSSLNGFYYRPRTDLSFIKKNKKGLIGLSACVGGTIPKAIMSEMEAREEGEADEDYDEKMISLIQEYKDSFEEFYLEIQPGDFDIQRVVNQELVRFSDLTDTPLVVTNDIHYLDEEDWILHDAHVKVRRKQKFDTPMIYPDKCYWFMDREELIKAFNGTIDEDVLNQAIDNTVLIAESVDAELDNELHLPEFTSTEDTAFLLSKKCFEILDEISVHLSDLPSYTSRLLRELDVINQLGFNDYFLIVEDFIRYAKENGIAVGPGRGSVGGSLVAYLLGITLGDPVKYNLLFERFLSVHRKEAPDIDIDFDSERRHEIFEYAIRKYGEERCSLVSTYGMRRSRSAIRDVARILDIDLDYADKAAKLIPTVFYDDGGEKHTDLSVADSVEVVPELNSMAEDEPRLFDFASRISDIPTNKSIHAAGMLISPKPLKEIVPLVYADKQGMMATSLSLDEAEMAGVVKFDFLSLASLSVYEKTQEDVNKFVDLTELDFDDEDVWSLIGSRYTTGLFQISSNTYKSRMPRLRPKSIQELAHCLALLRGPCISIGADRDYMDILEGKKEPDFIHPVYYQVTKDTQGILLYQEQIMELAVKLGFTLEEGYVLMKAVARKKPALIREQKEKFMTSGKESGLEGSTLERMFHMIEVSGQYSFNMAHAVSYATLSYVSAYLKHYYPKTFLKNLLTNAFERGKTDEVLEAVSDCRRMGYTFLPVDVHRSDWEFTIEEGKIRVGLCAIKGFGRVAAEELIEKRPFDSFDDAMERLEKRKCGKRPMIPAIFSGAFDEFGSREEVYNEFCSIRREEPLDEIRLQSKETFKVSDKFERIEPVLLTADFTTNVVIDIPALEFDRIKKNQTFSASVLISHVKRVKDRNGNRMAFMTLSSSDGEIEGVVFANQMKKYNKFIRKNQMIKIRGKKDKDDSCIVNYVEKAN